MNQLSATERELLEQAELFELFAYPAELVVHPTEDADAVDQLRPWRRVRLDAADRRRALEALELALRDPPASPWPEIEDDCSGGRRDPGPADDVGVHARRGAARLTITFSQDRAYLTLAGASTRRCTIDPGPVATVLHEVGDRVDVRLHDGATLEVWLARLESQPEAAARALASVIAMETRPSAVAAAYAALVTLGPKAAPAVPALVHALLCRRRQEEACAVLAAVGPAGAPAVDVLRARLRDRVEADTHPQASPGFAEREARLPPLQALSAIGPAALPALPEIARCLHGPEASIGQYAWIVLAHLLGDADVVGALARRLEAPAPADRVVAARALGALGPLGEKALPALSAAKDDPTTGRVADLARAQLQGDAPRAQALLDELLDHPTLLAPFEVVEELRRLGTRDHAPILAKLLGRPDAPAHVRWAAADALGELGPRAASASAALEACAAVDADPAVRSIARHALSSITREDPPLDGW